MAARAVATLYRSRISAGAIALLVLSMLLAVIVALWVSQTDALVLEWLSNYWHDLSQWLRHWVT